MTTARGAPRRRRLTPHGPLQFVLQLALLLAVDVVYETTRAAVEGSSAAALAHAATIIDIEQALGIFHERTLQRWALDAPDVVMSVARWIYQNCQRLIVWTFVVWLYLRRNAAYPRVRNTIIALDVLGIAGYLLYPTAPPRLTPGYGFVDVLDPTHANLRSSLLGSLTNLYAAVPSLHTAYALLLGITGVRVGRHLVTRVVWAIYPALVVLATVVTANHWFLDAVAGAAALAIAWPLAARVERVSAGWRRSRREARPARR